LILLCFLFVCIFFSSIDITDDSIQERVWLWSALLGRASAFENLKNDLAAKNDAMLLEELGGNSIKGRCAVAELHVEHGMLERARADLEYALEKSPNDADVMLCVAKVYSMQRLTNLALATIRKITDYEEGEGGQKKVHVEAMLQEGAILVQEKRAKEAFAVFVHLITELNKMVDRLTAQRREQASNLLELGRVEEELRVRRIQLCEAIFHQSDACLLQCDIEGTVKYLRAVIRANPDYTPLNIRPPSPGTLDGNGVKLHPGSFTPLNLQRALKVYDCALHRYGPDPQLIFHRANIHKANLNVTAYLHDLLRLRVLMPTFLHKHHGKDHGVCRDFYDEHSVIWYPAEFLQVLAGHQPRARIQNSVAKTDHGDSTKPPEGPSPPNRRSSFVLPQNSGESLEIAYIQPHEVFSSLPSFLPACLPSLLHPPSFMYSFTFLLSFLPSFI
jgi:tetratricopeptide (TPR) repeat protein